MQCVYLEDMSMRWGKTIIFENARNEPASGGRPGQIQLDTSLCGIRGYMLQRVLNIKRWLGKKKFTILSKEFLYFAGEIKENFYTQLTR